MKMLYYFLIIIIFLLVYPIEVSIEAGIIEFKKQAIYKHKISFKQAMKYLIGIDAIEKKQSISYPFSCNYTLTPNGKIFIDGLRK